MMNKCALLVVEGIKTEPTIFKYIFEKYGYKFINMNTDENWDAYKVEIDSHKTIYLVQGNKNRLNEFLDEYSPYDTLSQKYGIDDVVALNYIIYDFDYVNLEKMSELRKKFTSPQEGEMLLSNPCIEVIAENDFNYKHIGHSHSYKKRLKKLITDSKYQPRAGIQLIDSYICDNFEDFMIRHIKRNCDFFKTANVIEHPDKLIDYVMSTNIPNEDKELYEFHYLSTVIYVAIAELEGLTKQFDNANKVIDYFENKKNISKKKVYYEIS